MQIWRPYWISKLHALTFHIFHHIDIDLDTRTIPREGIFFSGFKQAESISIFSITLSDYIMILNPRWPPFAILKLKVVLLLAIQYLWIVNLHLNLVILCWTSSSSSSLSSSSLATSSLASSSLPPSCPPPQLPRTPPSPSSLPASLACVFIYFLCAAKYAYVSSSIAVMLQFELTHFLLLHVKYKGYDT